MASFSSSILDPPLVSPGIRISQPGYVSLPQRTSDDSPRSVRHERSTSDSTLEPGLGIQMTPLLSPTTPEITYSNQSTPKGKYLTSFASVGPRSPYDRTPDTLHSFGSNVSRARMDPTTERLIAHRAMQSTQWKVHWRTPALIVSYFLSGIALALGQHLLYQYLHHMHIGNEEQKVRYVMYGRILAYLSKVAFGGCVIMVYRQRIWTTFRRKALSVLSIDHLFGASEDPSLFGNLDLLTNAPVMVAIAFAFWLVPLATVIFSPGALTFGTYLDREIVSLEIPTLDFSSESYKNYRVANITADGVIKRSMVFWNTTDRTSAPKEGYFDYYDKPSAELERIAILLAYNNMNHPNVMIGGARQRMCGGSYNCTYTQTFIGPSYECEEFASGVGDNGRVTELGAPFNTSVLVPEGNKIYNAEVDTGDYKRSQTEFQRGPGGVPAGDIPENLGVFKTEPVLWIGWSINTTEPLPTDSPYAVNWTHRYEPHIMRCIHYETKYTIQWNFSEPVFHAMAMKREHIKPVIDTNFTRSVDGTVNTSDPQPVENFISPRTDVYLYKKTAAYHAIGQMLRQFLRGQVSMEAPLPGPSYAQPESDITKTRLVSKNSEPDPDLAEQVEAFYTDMVLSLLSLNAMLVVQNETVVVNRTRYQPSFVYFPVKLWICYIPVIFVTFIILLFGFWTIWQDGTTFSTGFSRILVTTRNTTLDDISRGACLGNDPFPMELMHTKLKFGVLGEGCEVQYMGADSWQSVGHCAFGVESEVTPIQKGVPYAGLQRRRIREDVEKEDY